MEIKHLVQEPVSHLIQTLIAFSYLQKVITYHTRGMLKDSLSE